MFTHLINHHSSIRTELGCVRSLVSRLGAFVILLCALLSSIHGLKASSFEAHGHLTTTYYRDNGDIAQRTRFQFVVAADGDQWSIKTTEDLDATSRLKEYYYVGCDGANVYKFAPINTNYSGLMLIGLPNGTTVLTKTNLNKFSGGNKATAEVTPGIVPSHDASHSSIIWLAYLSGIYLDRSTNRLKPIWSYPDSSLKYSEKNLPAIWEQVGGDNRIPRFVTYYSEGLVSSFEGIAPSLIPANPPYDVGFTNATYSAFGITAQGNVFFPKSFQFVEFSPKKLGSMKEDLRIICSIDGATVSCNLVNGSKRFTPDLMPMTLVTDYRVFTWDPKVKYVQYMSTGNWLQADAIKQLPSYQKKALRLAGGGSSSTNVKQIALFFGCFILVFTAFAAVLFSRLKRAASNNARTVE